METSFSGLKEKEIINLTDGKKLGRLIDIVFDNSTGVVRGIVVPGERKIFKKNEDIFIPIERLKKIGDDVILVRLDISVADDYAYQKNRAYAQNKSINSRQVYGYDQIPTVKYQTNKNTSSFVRYKRIDNKKYK